MSLKARPASKKDPMQKKVTPNPKYKDVKPVVDSGSSVNRYMRRLSEISENYRYRNDEIFKRIKVSTFVQLMLQVTDLERDSNYLKLMEADPELDGADDDSELIGMSERSETLRESAASAVPQATATRALEHQELTVDDRSRSSLQSVISGLGELDIKRGQDNLNGSRGRRDHNATSEAWWKNDPAAENDRCGTATSTVTDENRNESARSKSVVAAAAANAGPYLLLDVRDREEYDAGHIRTAISYPTAMLSRSVNSELPEMRAFRNEPGRIVIVYDQDESVAPRVAATLVQRGYDNLFMLSGGLKVARKLFPEGLLSSAAQSTDFDAESAEKVRAALETHMVRGNGNVSSSRIGSRASNTSRSGTRASVGTASSSRMSTAASSASTVRPTFK